ncbi:TolC family protein [candidate division KSB1 bacterium]|nr:TolC family protein [candidate division KSB1 bacterium]
MKLQFLMALLLILSGITYAQTDIVATYINQGLENNLALRQKQFSLEQSLQALKEARGLFLPSFGIEARYSRAGGGRIIEIPVGDLVNPVYRTLNQLLASIGQPPTFPEDIANQSTPFLRDQEHETKLRIIQPLFQPAIFYNYKIKSNLNEISKVELAIFERQLIEDIKKAYFNYLKAARVVEIYLKSHHLLKENLRVSQKLFDNQKATVEVVYRAQAELAELEQQLADAEKNLRLAAAYFNFLLNKPLDSEIYHLNESRLEFPQPDLAHARERAVKRRLETHQLSTAMKIAQHSADLSRSTFLPTMTGVFDYGFQGEAYRFTADDDYWMGSIVLQWNLFNGFQDAAKKQYALLERNKLEAQLAELNAKIELQVQEAYDALIVAQKAIHSANEREKSARKSFDIICKKFEQGMAPQIEYINARTALTNAEIAHTIAKYDCQIKYAIFEHVTMR